VYGEIELAAGVQQAHVALLHREYQHDAGDQAADVRPPGDAAAGAATGRA